MYSPNFFSRPSRASRSCFSLFFLTSYRPLSIRTLYLPLSAPLHPFHLVALSTAILFLEIFSRDSSPLATVLSLRSRVRARPHLPSLFLFSSLVLFFFINVAYRRSSATFIPLTSQPSGEIYLQKRKSRALFALIGGSCPSVISPPPSPPTLIPRRHSTS